MPKQELTSGTTRATKRAGVEARQTRSRRGRQKARRNIVQELNEDNLAEHKRANGAIEPYWGNCRATGGDRAARRQGGGGARPGPTPHHARTLDTQATRHAVVANQARSKRSTDGGPTGAPKTQTDKQDSGRDEERRTQPGRDAGQGDRSKASHRDHHLTQHTNHAQSMCSTVKRWRGAGGQGTRDTSGQTRQRRT